MTPTLQQRHLEALRAAIALCSGRRTLPLLPEWQPYIEELPAIIRAMQERIAELERALALSSLVAGRAVEELACTPQAPAVPDDSASREAAFRDAAEAHFRSHRRIATPSTLNIFRAGVEAALRMAAPAPQPAAVPDSQKLWLWQNGDHYLAFAHEYPCYEPAGDPMTLGEPVATALFRQSFDREQARSEPHLYKSSPDHGEEV